MSTGYGMDSALESFGPKGHEHRMIGIKRLAKDLNMSISTVSRALNERPDSSEATRKRVREAAERLGYVPNHSGRALRKGTTGAVAS